MGKPRYPLLYQINTRVYLTKLSREMGRPATLDDIPDQALDVIASRGFDWVWYLGVWQTGPAGQQVSRTNPEWRSEFQELLPDLTEEDIPGSCFAITDYSVLDSIGGDGALARLRGRLRARGLKLMLDFVPNHTAPDHRWATEHPDFYVAGSEDDLAREPQNYIAIGSGPERRVLAFGRDPYFAGWPDTLQLNYGNPALQETRIAELLEIAARCDGVRCDMAMLVLPEIFERTWGIKAEPFWPRAIERVRSEHPEFLFMAEVYWDLEWTLQQQGFDYCYDKRLYDRLREGDARAIRGHLRADLGYQEALARFLENHDEPRAAAVFPDEVQQSAAVVTFLTPGLRFLHQGQVEGYRKRIAPHLGRGPDEPVNEEIRGFYDRLIECLSDDTVRNGDWQLLECMPAWQGNPTADDFIAYWWTGPDGGHKLVAVNYSPHQSQCYVRLTAPELAGRSWRLESVLGPGVYDREGDRLLSDGLYLDLPAWGYHVFSATAW